MYTPITIRLIEEVNINGWNSIKNTIRLIPGKTEYPNSSIEKHIHSQIENEKKRIFLIIFTGGITFTEISKIRDLNKKSNNLKYFVITTNITNGQKMIESVIKDFSNNNSSTKMKGSLPKDDNSQQTKASTLNLIRTNYSHKVTLIPIEKNPNDNFNNQEYYNSASNENINECNEFSFKTITKKDNDNLQFVANGSNISENFNK